MNPEPEKKSEGGEKLDPASLDQPFKYVEGRGARFLWGFFLGTFFSFLHSFFLGQQFISSIGSGLIVGLVIGIIGALFGKRFFNVLMKFLN